ncbi:hypothetical protein D3C81_1583230 [compost metagenome]
MGLIGQADLLQHDRHLDAIGGGQGVQLNPLRVLGRPFSGDGERRQIGHVGIHGKIENADHNGDNPGCGVWRHEYQ